MAETLPAPPDPGEFPPLRSKDTRVLREGTRVWRIYKRGGDRPMGWDEFRFFGPLATARFDHHSTPPHTQERGILYGSAVMSSASAGVTCVAETFQEGRTIDPSRRQPWLVGFAIVEALTLLDLTSGWTSRAGGNQAICTGPRKMSRAWARGIYDAYPDVHGVFYTSSTWGPGRASALFERATSAMPLHPVFHRPLNDPGLRGFLTRAAAELGYELLA